MKTPRLAYKNVEFSWIPKFHKFYCWSHVQFKMIGEVVRWEDIEGLFVWEPNASIDSNELRDIVEFMFLLKKSKIR